MTKGFLCIVIQSFDTGAKTAILQARTLRTRQVKGCVNSELAGGTQVWVLAPQGSCLTPEGTGFADDVTHLFGFEARTTLFGFLFTNYPEPTSILA